MKMSGILADYSRRSGMRLKLMTSFASVVGFLLVCGPISAHHGLSAYWETNPVTLKGVVTEFAWSNPHSQIYFDVTDDKGNVVHWGCETLAPSRLTRAGWTRNSLKPGDKITITLIAALSGRPIGFLRKLVLADGRELNVMAKEL
jgi:hypothetical protein